MDIVVKELIYTQDTDTMLNIENIVTTLNELKQVILELEERIIKLENP